MVILNENFDSNIVNKNTGKYIFRLALLLIMEFLIKGFDRSFNGVFDASLRSIIFFFVFIIYWMAVWIFSSHTIVVIDKRINGKLKPIVAFVTLFFIILALAVGAAILFNFIYLWGDVKFFGMDEIWAKVPFPHPELIYPFILLSLLIFIIDRFIGFAAQLKDAELYSAHLEQENIQAKYDALKNQIDPHFFFNSLSVLSSIVHTDPDLSSTYIQNLSKLYRYTLETRQNNVVPLSEELDYLNAYIFLIKIRYPDCLNFNITLTRAEIGRSGIHPNSLQLLVENAIKHNTFKDDNPLDIEIFEEDGYISVKNQLRKKKQLAPSTGIGLENIRRRYELHGKKIIVREADGYFIVKLPKIEIAER